MDSNARYVPELPVSSRRVGFGLGDCTESVGTRLATKVGSSTNKGLQIPRDVGIHNHSHGICDPQHCPLASFRRLPGVSSGR